MRASLNIDSVDFFLECLALLHMYTHGQLNIWGKYAQNIEHDTLGCHFSGTFFFFPDTGSLIYLEVHHIVQGAFRDPPCFAWPTHSSYYHCGIPSGKRMHSAF